VNENETVLETVNEGVKETIAISGIKNLAYNKVVDSLEQMIDAGKLDFLDEKTKRSWRTRRSMQKTLLYNGSTMTKLEADILLLEMKTRNGMLDTGFNVVFSLLQKFVPSLNELPQNMYEAKQMICPLGLEV